MRTLIFPVLGGRGNRYFQLNAVLSTAKLLDYKRVICLVRKKEGFVFEDLDIDMKSPLISEIEFRYLRLNGLIGGAVWKSIHMQIRLSSKSKFPLLQIRQLNELFLCIIVSLRLGLFVKVFTSDNVGYCEISRVRTSILSIGYFQSLDYGDIIKHLYQRSEETFDKQTEKKFKRVMIHIRRGDYRLSQDLGILKGEYYSKIIKDLLRENVPLHFHIFCDEVLDHAEIDSIIGDVGPNTKTSLFFGNSFSEKKTFSLMSEYYDYYVMANSSFSYWATVIGQRQISKVFCPFPWFNLAKTPRNIYRFDWIKCPAEFEEYTLDEE